MKELLEVIKSDIMCGDTFTAICKSILLSFILILGLATLTFLVYFSWKISFILGIVSNVVISLPIAIVLYLDHHYNKDNE